MRIDLVITELNPGGAERCLTELAIGFAEGGDEVGVCSIASLPTGSKRLLVERLESAGVEVHSCNANRATQFLSADRCLSRWMRRRNAEICQTFLYHANVIGTVAAKRAGCRVRVGGLRVAEPSWFRGRIEKWATRQMSSLVCVSEAVQTFAAQELGCPPSKTIVIPNAVDFSRFSNAVPIDWPSLGWPADSEIVLFVGRMHEQKGIDRLQRHVDRIAPVDSSRKLLLVGEGPLEAEIDDWISNIGGDRVKRLPWQTDIAPFVRAATVFVLPSRYEGMPNVIMEAMAAGRPVVCSRVEGVEELLPSGSQLGKNLGDEQTFNAEDDSRMADMIESFCNNRDHGDEIGLSNQNHVRNHFSIPAMIDAYRQHYRALLAERFDDK